MFVTLYTGILGIAVLLQLELMWLFLCVIAAAVGELEACKLQHIATIEDLHGELVAAKQRSAELEKNKQSFEAEQHLKSSEHEVKLQSLQKVNVCYCVDLGFLLFCEYK